MSSRLISTKVEIKNKDVEIFNIYVPNGNPVDTEKYTYKLKWIDLFIREINEKLKKSNLILSVLRNNKNRMKLSTNSNNKNSRLLLNPFITW